MGFSCLHGGDAGDVIYSLPCVRAFAEEHGPVDLYLKPSVGGYHFGGTHFSRMKLDWITPLIQSQPYISSVKLWDGQSIDVDLNLFRKLPVALDRGDIAGWYAWAFPVVYDLTEPWLEVVGEPHGRIVVNRTERYQNPGIDYRFLTGHRVNFVGLRHEYDLFLQEVPDAEYVECPTALELARFLTGCRFFLGGQSLPYAVAEGLKIPRILEVCPKAPNCIPHGKTGSSAVTQIGFEWHFRRLAAGTCGMPPGSPVR